MSTPTFTMFHANCVGNAVNCLYSHKVEITDADTFRQAVRFDHVYAAYRDNYRSVGNFISANALPVDCDNGHSDDRQTGLPRRMWQRHSRMWPLWCITAATIF